jgi:hypothetical protein
MNTKLTHILFSLAVVAALVLTAVPAPVFALSAAPTTSATTATQLTAGVPNPDSLLVCHSFFVWRHGHRVLVRICHRTLNPS